jgi:hypothetical protein
MAPKPRPSPCFLDGLEKHQVISGKQVWTNRQRSRFFTWDGLHGEIEVFDRQGRHLGALHAVTGQLTKPAKKGRTLYGWAALY